MNKYMNLAWLSLALMAVSAAAQTVTGSGTANTVPVFTGTSTVGISPISISGGNVGIGAPNPGAALTVSSPARSGGTGQIYVGSINNAGGISFARTGDGIGTGFIGFPTGAENYNFNITSTGGFSYITFATAGSAERMRITNGGNVGIGTTSPGAKLEVNGGLRFTADPSGTVQTTAWTGVLCGGDYAESMTAAGGKKSYGPGDVLVLTSGRDNDVQKSSEPYSTLVAGIYATKPGVIGRRQSLLNESNEVPMAMVGVVPTKVTVENGPIHKGDLLVSSSMSGYAMKGTDRTRMLGAVIGKAMGSLESGSGVIEILVTLQ